MYTVEDYLHAGKISSHRNKTEEQVVEDVINILVDNLFTGVDVAVFIKANHSLIEKALDKKFFPNGHNINPKRKNRQS